MTRSAWAGETVAETPRFRELVASRLYFADGVGDGGTLEAFRLLFEGASTRPRLPVNEERLKVYEVVPGAELRLADAPRGAVAIATVDVTTNTGRRFRWSSARVADARGEATFRIPYATGANGAVRAAACEIAVAATRAAVAIADDDVELGRPVPVSLRVSGSGAAALARAADVAVRRRH